MVIFLARRIPDIHTKKLQIDYLVHTTYHAGTNTLVMHNIICILRIDDNIYAQYMNDDFTRTLTDFPGTFMYVSGYLNELF